MCITYNVRFCFPLARLS